MYTATGSSREARRRILIILSQPLLKEPAKPFYVDVMQPTFSALTLLAGRQEETHPACRN